MKDIFKIDEAKILTAVAKAESKAVMEIVTVIVPQSDSYAGAQLRLCITFFLLSSLLGVLLYPGFTVTRFFAFQLIVIMPCYLLSFIPFLLRIFLSSKEKKEEVYQRAIQIFHNYRLHSTTHRNGILIMVSKLEKSVQILVDEGLNAKIPAEKWKQIVDEMLATIKASDVTTAFVEAIEKCGNLVAIEFPKTGASSNEFPDAMRTE